MTNSCSPTTALADSHLHLFRRGYHRDQPPGREVERYEELRERHGIAAGLVVGYEADGIDPGNNGYLRELAAGRGWMTTLAYAPVSPAINPGELEQLLDGGHRGIALYCADSADADAVAGWPADAWRLLESRGAVVSLNAHPAAHAGMVNLARRTPGCRFLFSHLGLPGAFDQPPDEAAIAGRLSALLPVAKLGHCWVKMSGLYALSAAAGDAYEFASQVVTTLLDEFGPSRCLWGSDFSPCLDHGTFEATIAITGVTGLSAAERQQVMGGNLLALLGFPS